MNRDQKAVVIEEIATNIQDSQAIFAIDFRGITVPQAAELRDKLRAVDASFRVVKNSLTERAADRAGMVELKGLLAGPTALTFVRGDAATTAKAISDYGRATQRLAFKGGVMDGMALSAEQVQAISRLLSREALYGQLVGLVASPLTGLVRTLNALVGGLAIQLGAILEKKESGEIPAGDPPAAASTPDPEEPARAADSAASEPPPVEEPVAAEAPAGDSAGEAVVSDPGVAAAPASEEPAETADVSDPGITLAAASYDPPEESTVSDPPVAEPPEAPAATIDSGEEVAGAETAQAGAASAEPAPADEAPATDEPTHKEST